MTVDDLPEYLKTNWQEIRKQLLEGNYKPKPVRRVEIPKSGSEKKRKLGIPDQRVIKLTRAFLNSGVMEDGLVKPPKEPVAVNMDPGI